MDWLLISCIVTGAVGLILAFVLGAFWLAGEADETFDRINREIESERATRHGEWRPCPWEMKK